MSAGKLQELRLDAEEFKTLLATATRQKVKDALSIDLRKIETDIVRLQEQISKDQENTRLGNNVPATATSGNAKCYEVKITNYAWDQSDKFVKIFISLKNVHTIPLQDIVCEFKERSMELLVCGLENRNYRFSVLNLLENINTEKSYWKVKNDNLIIYMAKSRTGENWSHLTTTEKKVTDKKTPKFEPSDDPSAGIMNLLKDLYEDGDDEMKKTIAKAWTSSQEKKSTIGDMPSI